MDNSQNFLSSPEDVLAVLAKFCEEFVSIAFPDLENKSEKSNSLYLKIKTNAIILYLSQLDQSRLDSLKEALSNKEDDLNEFYENFKKGFEQERFFEALGDSFSEVIEEEIENLSLDEESKKNLEVLTYKYEEIFSKNKV